MQNRPTFTYLGHSTVHCQLPSGEVILINPWTAQNPACPDYLKEFDRIDIMLITNGHFDNCGDAIELAQKHRPIVIGTYELCTWLESQGVNHCHAMNIGGTQQVLNGIRITQVQALHSSSVMEDNGNNTYAGSATGFVVRLDSGYTFYHAGNTGLFSDMKLIAELYRPSLAFLPIGDLYSMDPLQAAHACKFLEVEQVVPIFWGTFPMLTGTPDMFDMELNNLGVNCEMIPLHPGEKY